MKEYIERQAEVLVEDLREMAEHISGTVGLDYSFDEAARVIWECGTTKDISDASNSCGRLTMLTLVAKELGIFAELSAQTVERLKWADLIAPV